MKRLEKEYSDGVGTYMYRTKASSLSGDRKNTQGVMHRLESVRCPPLLGYTVDGIRWKNAQGVDVVCEYKSLPEDAEKVVQVRPQTTQAYTTLPMPTYPAPCKTGDRLLPNGQCSSLDPEDCPNGDLVSVSLGPDGVAVCNYRTPPPTKMLSDEWMFFIAIVVLLIVALTVL